MLLLGGCGYRFAGDGGAVDPSLRTVFVAPFTNRTDEPALGNILRNALIEEIRRGSRFEPAEGRESADLLLQCGIRSYETYPASYRKTGFALENRVRVSVELTLEDRRTGNVLWSNRNMAGTETYVIRTDPRLTENGRRAALQELARDLAEAAFRLMTSGF
jgi:TolB-like protein